MAARSGDDVSHHGTRRSTRETRADRHAPPGRDEVAQLWHFQLPGYKDYLVEAMAKRGVLLTDDDIYPGSTGRGGLRPVPETGAAAAGIFALAQRRKICGPTGFECRPRQSAPRYLTRSYSSWPSRPSQRRALHRGNRRGRDAGAPAPAGGHRSALSHA